MKAKIGDVISYYHKNTNPVNKRYCRISRIINIAPARQYWGHWKDSLEEAEDSYKKNKSGFDYGCINSDDTSLNIHIEKSGKISSWRNELK